MLAWGVSEFCWKAADHLLERAARSDDRIARVSVLYEARALLTFLEHSPERARAEDLAHTLGQTLSRCGWAIGNAAGRA